MWFLVKIPLKKKFQRKRHFAKYSNFRNVNTEEYMKLKKKISRNKLKEEIRSSEIKKKSLSVANGKER